MRILIVDDHELFASGLRLLLEREFDAEVSYESSCEAALAHTASGARFDLILLDLEMPGMSGLEGVAMLKQRAPDTPVVIVSSHREPVARDIALSKGASAFISKNEAAEGLLSALHTVLKGGRRPEARGLPQDMVRLTPRQQEVLLFLASGKSNKVIARQLDMSENTVRNHVAAILEELGAANRHEAVHLASRLGLIERGIRQ